MPNEVIFAFLVVIAVVDGALFYWTRTTLRQRDDAVTAAQQELAVLKAQANNVALAKMLLQAEAMVATDAQAASSQLIADYLQEMRSGLSVVAAELKAAVNEIADEMQKTLSGISQELKASLGQSSGQMNESVARVINEHVGTLTTLRDAAVQQMESGAADFLSQYREAVQALHEVARAPLQTLSTSVERDRISLSEQLHTEVRRQQDELLARFDARLADVVSSYLTETLGNDLDLGAQGPYLFRMLEEHKADLKKELANGA